MTTVVLGYAAIGVAGSIVGVIRNRHALPHVAAAHGWVFVAVGLAVAFGAAAVAWPVLWPVYGVLEYRRRRAAR